MPDTNKIAENESAAVDAVAGEQQSDVSADTDNLADDLLRLEKLNLMRAVMIRLQGGRHPDAAIDALLERRMTFSAESFQGPYIVRLLCTVMMIFVFLLLTWGILWFVAAAFELNYFLRLLSAGVSTLMAAMAGVAVFHPSSVADEKMVKQAIEQRMKELNEQLKKTDTLAESDKESYDSLGDELRNSDLKKTSETGDMTKNDSANSLALEGTDDFNN